jgi:hypothetical protein
MATLANVLTDTAPRQSERTARTLDDLEIVPALDEAG